LKTSQHPRERKKKNKRNPRRDRQSFRQRQRLDDCLQPRQTKQSTTESRNPIRHPSRSRRSKSRFERSKWRKCSTPLSFKIQEQEQRWKQTEQSLLSRVDRDLEAAFGFVADYRNTKRHNASIALANMRIWLYHSRPTRMAFHDLTTRLNSPKNLRSLLGLNLRFGPNPGRNASWATIEKDILPRFYRDLRVKVFMAGAAAGETYNPKMYATSGWNPPNLFTPPELRARLAAFKATLKGLYKKRRCPSNLLKHQQRALDALRNQDTFLIVQCDKNLGPAVIEKNEYIRMAIVHLTYTSTYRRLSPLEARMYSRQIRQTILQWIKTHASAVSKNETE
jgi:hypothetical protein